MDRQWFWLDSKSKVGGLVTDLVSTENRFAMLHVPNLRELLNANVDLKLYPRIFVMTPNATLLSYTTPVDMRELRDQATLISMCWKDNANAIHNSTHQASSEAGSGQSHLLDTLTIEFDNANVIVRSLQERLLLVLVGGVPPNRQINFKATPEVTGDPRYPSAELKEEPPDIAQERASTSVPESSAQDFTATVSSSLPNGPTVMELTEKEKDIKLGILHIQRKKADALAAYIKGEFEGANIVMPDQVNDPLG